MWGEGGGRGGECVMWGEGGGRGGEGVLWSVVVVVVDEGRVSCHPLWGKGGGG